MAAVSLAAPSAAPAAVWRVNPFPPKPCTLFLALASQAAVFSAPQWRVVPQWPHPALLLLLLPHPSLPLSRARAHALAQNARAQKKDAVSLAHPEGPRPPISLCVLVECHAAMPFFGRRSARGRFFVFGRSSLTEVGFAPSVCVRGARQPSKSSFWAGMSAITCFVFVAHVCAKAAFVCPGEKPTLLSALCLPFCAAPGAARLPPRARDLALGLASAVRAHTLAGAPRRDTRAHAKNLTQRESGERPAARSEAPPSLYN